VRASTAYVGGGVGAVATVSDDAAIDVTDRLYVNPSGVLNVESSGDVTVGAFGDVLGELHLDDGRVTTDSIRVQHSGRVTGRGTIAGLLHSGGLVSPGASAGSITVYGYIQESAGTLVIEVGDHAAHEWDHLRVGGMADFDGTLDVRTLPSFSPSHGDIYDIASYDAFTGSFDTITQDGGPLSGFTLIYGATSLQLKVTGATDAAPLPAVPGALALASRRTEGGALVELALPQAADVRLKLFDVAGREVAILQEGMVGGGRHEYALAAGRAALGSGVYFARALVTRDGATESRTARVTLVR
jgi:hypothetical protein